MRGWAIGLGVLALSSAAQAAQDEEYLLGDVGVRIELPGGWQMLRWSDWDFKAESDDSRVMLFAWATPIQTPVEQGDLKAWAGVHVAKAEEFGGAGATVAETRLAVMPWGPTARSHVTFSFGEKGDGDLYGATMAVDGQMFHLATVSIRALHGRAEKGLDQVLDALDVRSKPAETPFGAIVEASGVRTELPGSWRVPLPREAATVNKALTALGLEDLDACWTALQPRPGTDPDVMATCPAAMQLGVVDAFSFRDQEAALRARLFGGATVPLAERLDLDGRTGLLFAPELSDRVVMLAVAPYDQGASLTWLEGSAGTRDVQAGSIRAALANTTWSGPHPVQPAEWVSYYLTYRPTSPVVWGPVLALLALLGLVVRAIGFGRKGYQDALDD